MRNQLKLLIAAKCQDILQLNLVLLGIFRQIFPAVLPGKGHSGSMTLLRVVLYRENVPFSQPRDWMVNTYLLASWKQQWKNYPAIPTFSSQPYYRHMWLFGHVQCHTEMLCNSRDESWLLYSVTSTDFFVLKNVQNLLCDCFSWKKSLQFGK